MDRTNLFERIEGYAQENFTTETLAYILETDHKVRGKFLDLLLSRENGLRKAFQSCRIATQSSFDFGRPDLEITSASGRGAKVFVEVKTQSEEGKSQVRRYLKRGHVAYLTPRGHGAPDLSGADTKKCHYLGHFFWDKVHSVIEKHGSQDILQGQFLKYLEARRMGPPEPISEKDLRASLRAADVIRKFQALVDAVREEVEPDWKREFGKNIGGKGADWGLATGDLPYWWFRGNRWKARRRGVYLSIGVYAGEGVQDRPYFYVELATSRKKFGNELEADGGLRGLCREVGWEWNGGGASGDKGCYKTFRVGTGGIDRVAQRQVENVRSEKRNIRKLVKLVEKMV